MRPGMRCLLELLRSDSIDLTFDLQEWEQALSLAEDEHVLPLAAHRCRQQREIPQRLRDRLKAIEREAAITAFYWSSELKGILRSFEEREIAIVPLKGPSLAERLYGDTARRVSYDLDLLVSKSEQARAEAILRDVGFTPGAPDDYHRQWYRGRTTVELHQDVENPLAFNFHVESMLSRMQRGSFEGQPCWQLTEADELLYLCLHGVRHRFERLSLVVDLCFAFEKLTASAMGRYHAEIEERTSLLTLGLAIARRLRPEIAPGRSTAESSAQQRHLDALADRLWNQLLTETSEPLDWRTLHSFYLEMELPGRRWRRRLKHLRILGERIIGPDYEFAARFGFDRAWQVRLLRPVRLVRGAMLEMISSGDTP